MQPTTTLKPSLTGLVVAGKTTSEIAAALEVPEDQARGMLQSAGLLQLVEGGDAPATDTGANKPPTKPFVAAADTDATVAEVSPDTSTEASTEADPPRRRRGRPRKDATATVDAAGADKPAPRARKPRAGKASAQSDSHAAREASTSTRRRASTRSASSAKAAEHAAKGVACAQGLA